MIVGSESTRYRRTLVSEKANRIKIKSFRHLKETATKPEDDRLKLYANYLICLLSESKEDHSGEVVEAEMG